MIKKIIILMMIFVGAAYASDGNGTPALKSVRVGIYSTPDTTWTDDTRVEFDSGTYTSRCA